VARLFDDASSEYLELGSAPVTAAPVTIACRAKLDDTTNVDTLISIGVDTANGNYFAMDVAGTIASDPLRVSSGDGLGTFVASSVNTTAYDGNWHSFIGVWASVTSRIAYFDGTAGIENTTSRTPTGLNRVRIGVLLYEGGASTTNPASGHIADVAIWNVALTAGERAAYDDGLSPRNIRPDALVFYAPLVRELVNIRGAALTASGTTVSSHPRIQKLYRKLGGIFKIVSGGGTTTNVSLDATLTLTPAFVRQIGKITAATTIATAGSVMSVGKALAATVTLTPTLEVIRVTLVALAATLTLTAGMVRSVGKNVAASVGLTAAFTRQMGLALAATTIATAGTVMSVGKTLAATVILTPAITVSRAFLVTLAATLSLTASLLKAVGLNQAAQTTLAAALTLSATVAPVVTPVRPFTGFGGLGWSEAKTRWSLRKRTWKPRR